MKNFFISYNQRDKAHAEWIGWQLEEAGYTIVMQAWDFKPGGNFVLDMHNALQQTERTLLILSANSMKSEFVAPEWSATFAKDPTGSLGLLCIVRVDECKPVGLLAAIAYTDLVGSKDANEARLRLLDGLRRGRPDVEPQVPFFGVIAPRLLVGPAPEWLPSLRRTKASLRSLSIQVARIAVVAFSSVLAVSSLLALALPTRAMQYSDRLDPAALVWAGFVTVLVEAILWVLKRRRRTAAARLVLARIHKGEPA